MWGIAQSLFLQSEKLFDKCLICISVRSSMRSSVALYDHLRCRAGTAFNHSGLLSLKGQMMRETKLIDMRGLSGDPVSDDLLEDLFFRLESELPDAPRKSSKRIYLPSCITMSRLAITPVKRAAGKIRMIMRQSAISGRITQ